MLPAFFSKWWHVLPTTGFHKHFLWWGKALAYLQSAQNLDPGNSSNCQILWQSFHLHLYSHQAKDSILTKKEKSRRIKIPVLSDVQGCNKKSVVWVNLPAEAIRPFCTVSKAENKYYLSTIYLTSISGWKISYSNIILNAGNHIP